METIHFMNKIKEQILEDRVILYGIFIIIIPIITMILTLALELGIFIVIIFSFLSAWIAHQITYLIEFALYPPPAVSGR